MTIARAACILILGLAGIAPAADFPRFEPQEIDKHSGEIVYAVTVADVDGDKKPDVVAVTEDAVLWYENPSWKRHMITQGRTARDNVCIQAHDIDGDGRIDLALGAGWRPSDTQGASTLQWLGRDAQGEWQIHPITFAEPSMHRMRWGKVLGDGKAQLVVAPLQGRGTKGPGWQDGPGAKVTVYSIPADPLLPDWPTVVASQDFHTIHNLQLIDLDHDGTDEIVLATREAVTKLERRPEGHWTPIQIGPAPGEESAFKGAGEVKVGKVKNREYVATIEPFHGNSIVAYVFNGNGKPSLRTVVDSSLTWGHAVWCADLDGDGNDEMIIGQRDPNKANAGTANPVGPGIRVYVPNPSTEPLSFTRHVVDDGGMACEDALAADLDGDGKPEIIAGGRATHNVKIYWNKGPRPKP